MTVEELASKAGWLGYFVVFVGGVLKWLGARETARPATTEQAGAMMESAFTHLRAELDRTDKALAILREDVHRARNALATLQGLYAMLVRFTQDCIDALGEAGLDLPEPPRGVTVDDLMNIPPAPYTFGGTGPVSNKDNGR